MRKKICNISIIARKLDNMDMEKWAKQYALMDETQEPIENKYVDELSATNDSECCGAPVWDDTDICTECGEHCGIEEEEE